MIAQLYETWIRSTTMERSIGSEYYSRQRQSLVSIAETYWMRHASVIGAYAALSPNNDEEGNYRDVVKCIEAHRKGLALQDFTTSTYGPNKAKAMRILSGADPLVVLGGMKVRSFYRNTLNPEDPEHVTVDGHMVSCWHGKRLLLRRSSVEGMSAKINTKQYAQIAADIKLVAKYTKLLPNQMQSVLWLTWKRLYRIRYNPQQKLWPPEERVGGLFTADGQSVGIKYGKLELL